MSPPEAVQQDSTETGINEPRQPSRWKKIASTVVAATMLGPSMPGPIDTSGTRQEVAHQIQVTKNTQSTINLEAAQKETQLRDEFLRLNEVRKRAEVITDSGMKINFYTPGTSRLEVEVNEKAVNDLTNFMIASLSFFKQDYMSDEDIAFVQNAAAGGRMGNLEVTVLMCDRDSDQVASWVELPVTFGTVECPFGALFDPSRGYREESKNYHPFMAISFDNGHETASGRELMHMFDVIPEGFSPSFQQARKDVRRLSPEQSMTAALSHELAHILVHPRENIDDQTKEHSAIVTPLGQITEMLLTKTPEVVNLTPYEVETVFDIKRQALN